MAINPSKSTESANSPIERANSLNDPQFQNIEGYFPYDLTHQEFITPLFGQITPCMHLDTVPGDRIVYTENSKTILNQINGNFLSTLNQYTDTYFVPLRSLFPSNYEKLIPNPSNGSDLPNAALPQCPISRIVTDYFGDSSYGVYLGPNNPLDEFTFDEANTAVLSLTDDPINIRQMVALMRMHFISTVFSRGQLLDYLGLGFEDFYDSKILDYSEFQAAIDNYHFALYNYLVNRNENGDIIESTLESYELPLTHNYLDVNVANRVYTFTSLSEYRDALSSIYERGHFPFIVIQQRDIAYVTPLVEAFANLLSFFKSIFTDATSNDLINYVNTSSDPFRRGFINIAKPLAYQQCVAQYHTNNSIDNIFNSDLYMQLLRAIMFPSVNGFSSEPTFDYNGVPTEYDYISVGAIYHSLISTQFDGNFNRVHVWMTLLFLLRRSLRYGDYFTTARPRMLAVGNYEINVENGKVAVVDVTKNILLQRYGNAVNYIGSGFIPYMQSIHGVTPSDTATFPRFISHRKVVLGNDVVNNTSDNQGYQTTNIIGYANEQGFDVFIDDFGIIISTMSYDVLPVYKQGIDSSYRFADRFDYFNPMLQNIGDQPILYSELTGRPFDSSEIFGYTMRNGEYKYKLSKAHGAFVNELKGFMLGFPLAQFSYDTKINPDFIRDKPVYLDALVPQMTGVSPAQYYHFAVAVTNVLQCARMIQAQPPVLF